MNNKKKNRTDILTLGYLSNFVTESKLRDINGTFMKKGGIHG